MSAQFMIWWTTAEDCDAIGESPKGLPAYIRDEYRSRLGRNGRGRLWVHASLEWQGDARWLLEGSAAEHLQKAGGIVVRAEDVHHLASFHGVITAATEPH